MKSERIPFQPIGDIDERLEQLAREKGVSTMVKPEKSEQGAKSTEAISAAIASTGKARPKSADVMVPVERPDSEATPRSRMKSVNMELPDYLWTDLKIQAAHRQTSVRHVIMSALREVGFRVTEVDMVEDGRRLRGGSPGRVE